MPDSQQKPWSNDLNAPKIPYDLHLREKNNVIGTFISSIFYGMAVMLFFKCMAALFNSVHRRGEYVKWGLISYTVVMFSFVTIHNAVVFKLISISYVDNRDFSGVDDLQPPGPCGYQQSTHSGALNLIAYGTFIFNGWLADGLLLHRCYLIYSKNLWVIVFPCLMYLGSIGMGIVLTYDQAISSPADFGILSYLSISVSLNVLLTFMIVIQLAIHTRNIQTVMGTLGGISGLYKAIATMLVESCALYAVNSLLVIIPVAASSNVINTFPILAQTQVIASLLIIQRVADKSTLTHNAIVSGHISEFKARTRGSLIDSIGALPSGGDPMSSVNERGTSSGELED